ncbi:MAG: hypothetical protein KatS3mg105_3294 [Gemmatales bacterium]|nr:MAG: hypothetical protein KatS3mg105_3294 [Gemmatales bacterium]
MKKYIFTRDVAVERKLYHAGDVIDDGDLERGQLDTCLRRALLREYQPHESTVSSQKSDKKQKENHVREK